MPSIDLALVLGSIVALVAIFAARLGSRLGLPALLLFLFLGMALGNNGLGLAFSDASLAHGLGFAALVLILAEGGLTTKWANIRPALGVAGLLATVGIGVSIGLMTLFGLYVLDLSFPVALLLGAVTAPTDSAAVFAVLRGVPLPSRVRAILEAESGLNDAPTVLLVAAASELALGVAPHGGALGLLGMVLLELVGGLALGAALGVLGVIALRTIAFPRRACTPWRRCPGRWPPMASASSHMCRASRPSMSVRWRWAMASFRTVTPRAPSRRASAGSPRSACSSCWACSPIPVG